MIAGDKGIAYGDVMRHRRSGEGLWASKVRDGDWQDVTGIVTKFDGIGMLLAAALQQDP